MERSAGRQFNLFLKRTFDIVVSLGMIIVLIAIPVLPIVFIAVAVSSKGPVIFTQKRIGKDKKPFVIYKFRTMIVEQYDQDGNEIMSEDRITKVGRILRKTSLDELAQLFNVLGGSMSLIGPRPMLEYQAERCDEEQSLRFAMRPGVTGWAQVKGRNNIQWPERIRYDLEYIKNYNFGMDIKILVMTVLSIIRKEGTDVKVEYRGVDPFSKHYVPEEKK